MKLYRILSILILSICVSSFAEEKRPNILIILADDQGFADVSINPYHPPEVNTPNIDSLARSGVIMTNGYTTGHVCAPTRLGLMTGRYQHRYGTFSAGDCGAGVPIQHKLIANYMQEQGYTNGAFGKWHMGLTEEHNPVKRGFNEFFGFMGRGSHDYFDLANTEDPVFRGLTPIAEKGYLTNRITEEAIKFIANNKGKPWFCYVPYNAVHAPQQAPAEDIKRYNTGDKERDILMAMLYHMDKGVGEIMETLKKTNQYENTIVFYLSDNGGSSAMSANNAPFRGAKQYDFEGGVHVPFYVSWPGKIQPGTKCDVPVFSMDILPTACVLGGVEIPDSHKLDGKDFMPAIMGKTSKIRDFFCWNDAEGKWAIRSNEGWKLVGINGKVEMFNLNDDIGERKNLIAEYPEKHQQLLKAYKEWLDTMPEPKKGFKEWSPDNDLSKKKKKDKNK